MPEILAQSPKPSIVARVLAGRLDRMLDGAVSLRISDHRGGAVSIGSGTPQFEIKLKDSKLAWELLRNPSLVFGEAYMNERMAIVGGSVFDLLDLVAASIAGQRDNLSPSFLKKATQIVHAFLRQNTRSRSRTNVEHHYDDKSDLWNMFLDSYRQYTCGYFAPGVNSLDEAQRRKMDHIARKLVLRPGLRILDIGSGWGGLAVHLARSYGVAVDGITLSEDQRKFAAGYAEKNGVSNLVNFKIQDYRAVDQTYDRVVAVGMLEHVGARFYSTYFRAIWNYLKRDGVALVHAIGHPGPPGENEPFINKYIFPGSHAPSLSELVGPVERSGLFLTDVEVWRQHYAHTLRAWREKFYENWQSAEQKFGKRFCRMWEYYLGSCEVAFRRGLLEVFQLQLAKQFDKVPIARDYQYAGLI